ncbi:hypothetical protein [Bosea sp. UNC402CLCol]|uniref:hypothetical protein n=1 Tax=Bosea sp. UNC402CLCol TaxID=1510531 RepID=UPI0005708170|nr:hypothetical protein [Bosea sp. UNC402CLCol]
MTTTNDAPAPAPSGLVKKLENAAELLAMNDAFGGVQLVIAETIAALSPAPSGSGVREALAHEANEWADLASTGFQWLKNIRDGISTVEDAIANMEQGFKHCHEVRAPLASDASPRGEAITARYTNWRGETAERTFIPHRVFFGSNEWHPEPQVLIEAMDCEKGALRTFAAAGFAHPAPATVESWQDIASAPKDGTVFFGIGHDDAYPQAMRWQAYSADEIEEIGEPGYWAYCEDLIGDVTGSASPLHWRPMFPLPSAALAPATEGGKG